MSQKAIGNLQARGRVFTSLGPAIEVRFSVQKIFIEKPHHLSRRCISCVDRLLPSADESVKRHILIKRPGDAYGHQIQVPELTSSPLKPCVE